MSLENLFGHFMFCINFVNYLELSKISRSSYPKQISSLRAKHEVQFSKIWTHATPVLFGMFGATGNQAALSCMLPHEAKSLALKLQIEKYRPTHSGLAFESSQALFFFH